MANADLSQGLTCRDEGATMVRTWHLRLADRGGRSLKRGRHLVNRFARWRPSLATVISFVSLIVALVLAATALAVPSAAPDPSRLILARSDFPAGTKYMGQDMPASYIQALAKAGIKAKAKAYYVDFHKGHYVSGIVTTTEATSKADELFGYSKADMLKNTAKISLPGSYGDQQIALISKRVGKVELLVRKNRIVWEVEVLLGVPKASLIAELKTYAAKQQRRIGSG